VRLGAVTLAGALCMAVWAAAAAAPAAAESALTKRNNDATLRRPHVPGVMIRVRPGNAGWRGTRPAREERQKQQPE